VKIKPPGFIRNTFGAWVMCDIFDTLKVYFVDDLRNLIKILDHFWALILDQHGEKEKVKRIKKESY